MPTPPPTHTQRNSIFKCCPFSSRIKFKQRKSFHYLASTLGVKRAVDGVLEELCGEQEDLQWCGYMAHGTSTPNVEVLE
jgi:hypothetical protein